MCDCKTFIMSKMMKRKYVLLLLAGLGVLASCSPVHRYGCNRRCRISLSQVEPVKETPKSNGCINS